MGFRYLCGVAVLVGVSALFPIRSAHAKDKYQTNIVPYEGSVPGDGFITIGKKVHGVFTAVSNGSKIQIKESTKNGDGGVIMKLILHGVDCPVVTSSGGCSAGMDNDNFKQGKCDSGSVSVANDPCDHVLDLSVNALGSDLASVAGINYALVKGKAVFQDTGKNYTNGAFFGVLSAAIFNHPLGIEKIVLRTPGSDNSTCTVTPLAPGNACTDGTAYGIAGITFGCDPDVAVCP